MARALRGGTSCMNKTCEEVCRLHIANARRVFVRPDGTPTRQANNIKLALREVIADYGVGNADRFHSSHMRAIRSSWVASGLTRPTINARTRLIVACWDWACEMGFVHESTVAHLRTVRPLKRGQAGEGKGVTGIDPSTIIATLPFLQGSLAGMMRFMMLTGCRVGEAREARSVEMYRGGGLWVLRPAWHKTSRHGCSRSIVLSKAAQEIVRPLIDRKFMFGKTDGETPYHRDAVTVAVYRACDRAGVARWSPGQIRHTAATTVYEQYGLEATRALLGHTTDRVTRTYVHATDERAIAEVVGSLEQLTRIAG